MGKYDRVTLDRGRAFDVNSLQELLMQGKSILNKAVDLSRKMEVSISAIAATYSGIEGGYKVGALGSDLGSIRGTLLKEVYQDTIDHMEKILTKLMDDMPVCDSSLAQAVDGIGEILGSVRGRIEELWGLLEAGDVNLAYEEFQSRLEEVKAGWDMTTGELADALAEIENDMLGVTAAAVQYSRDPVNLSTGNFVYDHEDLKIGGEIPLSFRRYYNSKTRGKGCLGRCFVHNYEPHLEENPEKGKITVTMGDGQKKTFRKKEDGTYRGMHSAVETLTEEGDNYVLTTLAGERTVFARAGQMIRQENRHGRGITFSYGEEGRLERAETDNGAFLKYAYDEDGQLVLVEDHTGREAELSYEKGKISAVRTPAGSVYTYDAKGQLIGKLDKEGYLTKYGYTAQGDISRIAYADGREVKLSYNPLRQLVEMKDWLGITKIENDAAGRALKVQYPDGKEVAYTYGKSGERTGITYPDGRKAEYLYDEEVRLSGLDDGNGMIRYRYDEAGRLSRKTFPNGMETSYLYNAAGYLAELVHRNREGILDRYTYQYDLTGNKISIGKQRRGLPEESGTYAYGYDALGRLSSVSKDGQNLRTYEYDAFGNRSLLREGGMETSYVYNALNQLLSRADAVNEETYAYDRRGNLSLITENGALKKRYIYGAINRLEQAVNGNGEAASYTYNGLGHRVGKEINRPGDEDTVPHRLDERLP